MMSPKTSASHGNKINSSQFDSLCFYDFLYLRPAELLDAYLDDLPEMDKAMWTEALGDFRQVAQDYLLVFLASREAKVLATTNVKYVVAEKVHRDFIKVPNFVT